MLSTMADWLLGCSHRNTGFPITFRRSVSGGEQSPGAETYVVCLDCGKHFAYDWAQMRIAKESPVRVGSAREQEREKSPAPLPAGNRFLHRLVHHT